jgi:ribosomal protein S19
MGRAKWKGPYIKVLSSKFKLDNILPRNFAITAKLIGQDFNVHNGKTLVNITITSDMIGCKIGEFVPTRAVFVFTKKKKKKVNKWAKK